MKIGVRLDTLPLLFHLFVKEIPINVKKVYRLWRELKLALPKLRPKKKRSCPFIGIMPKALAANQIWTYDFVFDEAVSGRKLKMLTLIDEYTREYLAG